MGRRKSRESAMRFLFMMEYHRGEDAESLFAQALESFGAEAGEPVTDDEQADDAEGFGEDAQEQLSADDFTRALFFGAMENIEQLDAAIAANTVGWRPERLSKVMLALLRLAIYEIKYYGDTPASIAVNEAVELSKRYDEPGAYVFLNGVLGAVARQ